MTSAASCSVPKRIENSAICLCQLVRFVCVDESQKTVRQVDSKSSLVVVLECHSVAQVPKRTLAGRVVVAKGSTPRVGRSVRNHRNRTHQRVVQPHLRVAQSCAELGALRDAELCTLHPVDTVPLYLWHQDRILGDTKLSARDCDPQSATLHPPSHRQTLPPFRGIHSSGAKHWGSACGSRRPRCLA